MNVLSACAIFKWEQPWLIEWIEYHRAVGVEHFTLYANEEAVRWEQSQSILAPYVEVGLVDLQQVAQTGQQLPVYNQTIETMRGKTRWLAFIDLDEFLYPVQSDTVTEVLREFEDCPALAVNWCSFGSSGLQKRPESTLKSFVYRGCEGWDLNRHVKSIVDPSKARAFVNDPHRADVEGGTFDENRNPVSGPFKAYSAKHLRVNHYPIKSRQDFDEVKSKRGRADQSGIDSDPSYFLGYDRNEVFDDGIARRFA